MVSRLLLPGIIGVTVSLAVAGCTAVVYEVQAVPVAPAPDRICTRDYVPVCGERRGSQRTFGNACEADASGYRIVYGGECRYGPPPGPPSRPRPHQSDRFCTRDYAPVCGRRGDRVRTFSNACEAEIEGYRVIDFEPC